jgi:serine/threonine protein kinase
MKSLVRRLAHSLKQMKDLNVIHADLKLENILLSPKASDKIDKVVLIDFGSSIILNEDSEGYENIQITTPEYMPPELLEFST